MSLSDLELHLASIPQATRVPDSRKTAVELLESWSDTAPSNRLVALRCCVPGLLPFPCGTAWLKRSAIRWRHEVKIPNPQQTAMLAGIFLLADIANSIYAAFRLRPSGAFLVLYYVGVAWAFAAWVAARRSKDVRQCWVGFRLDRFVGWPVVVPYHVLRTRGIRGFVTLAGFIGLFVATYLLALIVFYGIVLFR